MRRTRQPKSGRQRLGFEQLESRQLLAATPVGAEITLVREINGAKQISADSLTILPDGSQLVFVNTISGTPAIAGTSPDNEPKDVIIRPKWPPTFGRGDVSDLGRIIRVNNVDGFLYSQECSTPGVTELIACNQGALLNPPDVTGSWELPSWNEYDFSVRDDGVPIPNKGLEGIAVWTESWFGIPIPNVEEHRIRARLFGDNGAPIDSRPFIVPGSQVAFGNTTSAPSVDMSDATGAVVVTWIENGIPKFSLRQANGTWSHQGVPAMQPSNGVSGAFGAVSMEDDGSFVMAWVERGIVPGVVAPNTLVVQKFNSLGNLVHRRVIDSTDSSQDWSYVDVDTRDDGSYVVVAVDEMGSQDVLYFDFDADGSLKPYFTGINPVTSSLGVAAHLILRVDIAKLPTANLNLTGSKIDAHVTTNAESFVVSWTHHESNTLLPWRIESRLFNEGTSAVLGRAGNTSALWLSQVDLGTIDGELPMDRNALQRFPAGHTWGEMLVGDFDGDGSEEVMSRSAETGDWWINDGTSVEQRGKWSPRVEWVDIVVGDFDGDNDDDIAGRVDRNGAWWISLANGSSQMTNKWFGNWSPRIQWTNAMAGDFNGDGKTDIVGRTAGAGAWWVSESNGFAFQNSRWGVWSATQPWSEIHVGDFNGDGSDDLLGRIARTGAWFVGESQQTGFKTTVWGNWHPNVSWKDVVIGDFNHDGASDIAGRAPGANNWWVAESQGDSFRSKVWTQWDVLTNFVDVVAGDFSGDGRDDILGRKQGTGEWFIGLSTGVAFSTLKWGQWPPGVPWTEVQSIQP